MKTFLGFTTGALTGLLAGAIAMALAAMHDERILDMVVEGHREYTK